jgi:hypothetical protein
MELEAFVWHFIAIHDGMLHTMGLIFVLFLGSLATGS